MISFDLTLIFPEPVKLFFPFCMCCSDIVACSLEQMNLSFRKTMKWWEKGLQTNMRAIQTARDLVESLTNAGDRLVIVDFFSPGCAGCHALHPKVIIRKQDTSMLHAACHVNSIVLF